MKIRYINQFSEDCIIFIFQVRETLRKNGAMEESFISSLVTHIVTDSPVDNKENLLGDDCTAVIINVG